MGPLPRCIVSVPARVVNYEPSGFEVRSGERRAAEGSGWGGHVHVIVKPCTGQFGGVTPHGQVVVTLLSAVGVEAEATLSAKDARRMRTLLTRAIKAAEV